MNIKFTDKALFNCLKENCLASSVVGSTLYGTNNDKSDLDILFILPTFYREKTTPFPSFHQLQYVDEQGNDHLFVSLHSFIKNTVNGDSTINFELIQSGNLENTNLNFLDQMKNDFINYKIIRSYLGFAKRDLKMMNSSDNPLKKMSHAIRGYYYAKSLVNKDKFVLRNEEWLNVDINEDNLKTLKEEYTNKVNDMRLSLNNGNTLDCPKYFDILKQKELTEYIVNLVNGDPYDFKEDNLHKYEQMIMEMFYNANENWVEY
jgi:predicted nucleotidyltransferase